MSDLFGSSRTVVTHRYALITPDGFVPSLVPGWKNAVVIVNISPVMGARFTQLHVTLAADGACEGNTGKREMFIYILEGSASVLVGEKRHRLATGSYAFIPPQTDMQLNSSAANTRLVIFEKHFKPLAAHAPPKEVVGHEREVKGRPFLGNNDALLQVLLPDNPDFDMAVNIFTYQPGATLPFVETHVMEHGLLMLKGQGIYRLDADHHPVRAGDVIWMASHCPQWFVAMGKTPASYIYYKDVNRDPLA